MSLYIPTFSEICNVAREHGQNSDAPDLWKNLVGAWPLQEGGGGTGFDASGFSNNCTVNSKCLRAVRECGRVLFVQDMAGVPAVIPHSAALNLSPPWTLSIKYRIGAGTPDSYWALLMKGNYDTMPYGLLARFVNPTNAMLYFYYKAGTSIVLTTEATRYGAVVNTWYTLSASYDGAATEIWQNGKFLLRTTGLSGSSATTDNIGIASEPDAGFADFAGDIASIWIHNRVLTAEERTGLYARPWAMYTRRRKVFAAAVAAPPVGAIMNQFQHRNLGADLFDGTLLCA